MTPPCRVRADAATGAGRACGIQEPVWPPAGGDDCPRSADSASPRAASVPLHGSPRISLSPPPGRFGRLVVERFERILLAGDRQGHDFLFRPVPVIAVAPFGPPVRVSFASTPHPPHTCPFER